MRKLTIFCSLCLAVIACFAQDAPKLSTDQKLAIREAQHKLDAIEKQQKDLGLQIADLQSKIQNESQRLAKASREAKDALDKATADAAPGIDFKKWQLDSETLTFTAVPAPAAPPNASNPPKPVPGSSGAAAPPSIQPAQQAKK